MNLWLPYIYTWFSYIYFIYTYVLFEVVFLHDGILGDFVLQNPISSVQFSCSVISDCHPMDCIMPGFPVHHQLLELVQTPFHQVCDAIQQSHPLSSPSPPAFNLSQHQGLFQWVSSSHQVATEPYTHCQIHEQNIEINFLQQNINSGISAMWAMSVCTIISHLLSSFLAVTSNTWH